MERPRTQARERTWSVTKMRAGVQRRRCRGRRRGGGRRAQRGRGDGVLRPPGGVVIVPCCYGGVVGYLVGRRGVLVKLIGSTELGGRQ